MAATYNPAFRNLSATLQKNFNILYLIAEVRTVFTSSLFFFFLLIEELEDFGEAKILSIRKNSGLFKMSRIL